ncbi:MULTISPECIES: penicillin-binding protein 2 [Streptomyces]|uniref:Penicillin-binding protein 2 n=1 Tax=Streptomyces lycii TaxID=2654337 RepID=A0ABQ7FCF6_9ACTN|nr:MULTISPECIES: penicillin-binding protein 2 [Streptomyces]KAF4406764.1 penicillin-binding protein 2 [Streptomyces lycii]PGH48385.1 penicillin-binding protein [Streptomyces sp. Ru87]
MIRQTRHLAAFLLLLLIALLATASRIQVLDSERYEENEANRRQAVARYSQPRGDIHVGGEPVTGSRDTGERLAYERTYTNGPLYAPVTGYASQAYGTSLLENAEDDLLSGTDGRLSRFPLWTSLTREQQPPGDVHTTIDPAVQRAAAGALGSARGAVAAVEPSTGKILALVSSPSYDPERFSGSGSAAARAWQRLNAAENRPMLNRALRQTYPPGSTFKVVTAAAALDSGLVRDLDEPTDSPAPYTLPGTSTELTNEAAGCEDATLRHAFEVSCNTVFARLGVRAGLGTMVDTAEKSGFNDDGLRIPSRVAESVFDTDMNDSQLALSAIGQYNTAATPLQMAMVASAVANDGELRRPYLVDHLTDAGGDRIATTRPRTYERVMDSSTARSLAELMRGVVTDGTGTNAAVPGAEVGGKTGTAQHGVENEGIPYAWFISWAKAEGADDPAVAVAVVVEDAEADRADISGGGNAAPVARRVMEAALGR